MRLLSTLAALAFLAAAPAQAAYYQVKTCDDYDPGAEPAITDSFRDALEKAAASPEADSIVFKVGCTIAAKAALIVEDDTRVLGSTAPYPGMRITGHSVRIKGSNVEFEGMHLDPIGHPNPENADPIGVENGSKALTNVFIHHITARWGCDELLAILPTNFAFSNIVVSDSLFYEPQMDCGHPDGAHNYGMLVGSGSSGVVIVRNLFAHINVRNPIIQGGSEALVANNLVYNYGIGPYVSASSSWNPGAATVSMISNHCIAGPNTPPSKQPSAEGRHVCYDLRNLDAGTEVFVSENIGPNGYNTMQDLRSIPELVMFNNLVTADPLPYSMDLLPVGSVFEYVLRSAGPKWRDAHDWRVVGEVRAGAAMLARGRGSWVRSVAAPSASDDPAVPDSGDIPMARIEHQSDPAVPGTWNFGNASQIDPDAPDGATNFEQFLGSQRTAQ